MRLLTGTRLELTLRHTLEGVQVQPDRGRLPHQPDGLFSGSVGSVIAPVRPATVPRSREESSPAPPERRRPPWRRRRRRRTALRSEVSADVPARSENSTHIGFKVSAGARTGFRVYAVAHTGSKDNAERSADVPASSQVCAYADSESSTPTGPVSPAGRTGTPTAMAVIPAAKPPAEAEGASEAGAATVPAGADQVGCQEAPIKGGGATLGFCTVLVEG